MDAVDWGRIGRAMAFYRDRGFTPVELPWFERREVTSLTCQLPHKILSVDGHGDLVGSAEQSFLGAELDGLLGKGRFVACTPCFRNEAMDRTHRVGFMKVELYRNDVFEAATMFETIMAAVDFFEGETGTSVKLVETDEGYDLEIGGLEIGSYGMRAASGLEWVYGTGLAEPRLSTAIMMLREANGPCQPQADARS